MSVKAIYDSVRHPSPAGGRGTGVRGFARMTTVKITLLY